MFFFIRLVKSMLLIIIIFSFCMAPTLKRICTQVPAYSCMKLQITIINHKSLRNKSSSLTNNSLKHEKSLSSFRTSAQKQFDLFKKIIIIYAQRLNTPDMADVRLRQKDFALVEYHLIKNNNLNKLSCVAILLLTFFRMFGHFYSTLCICNFLIKQAFLKKQWQHFSQFCFVDYNRFKHYKSLLLQTSFTIILGYSSLHGRGAKILYVLLMER